MLRGNAVSSRSILSHECSTPQEVAPAGALAATLGLAPRQLTAGVVDWHATASSREPINGCGVALWSLDGVQAIVLHAGFLDRLNDGEIGLAGTLRAAKGLAAIVDVLKASDAQARIRAAMPAL